MKTTTDKKQVNQLMKDNNIYSRNKGVGIFTPCEYCQKLTEVWRLTKFRITDDEKINVCPECEDYLNAIADGVNEDTTDPDNTDYWAYDVEQDKRASFDY